MNAVVSDLNGRELSYEEFEQLAANVPKRPRQSVFSLIEIDIIDDPEEIPSMYPKFRISRCCKGIFSSLPGALDAMRSCVRKNATDIYCFKIYELPLDTLCDLWSLDYPSCIREYLYGPKGDLLEHTVCSNLAEDLNTQYGHYLGKPKSQLRFSKGDIVEVIGTDTVSLAIVSHDPIDTRRCYDLYRRTRNDSKHHCYILDYSDDQVAVVDGPDYGNHVHVQLCDMMAHRSPLPEELRHRYDDYLAASQTPD